MNKRITLGAALALMAIVAAVTFTITIMFSMQNFNDKVYNLKEREAMYSKLAEIDRVVRQNFNGAIDETILSDNMVDGYVRGLGDPYSRYLTAEVYTSLMQSYDGKYVGVGVETVLDANGYMRVIEVYSDSPAYTVGIAKNDLVVKIDGTDVTQDNYQTLVNAMKGEAGTTLKMTVRRNNKDEELELTRRTIETPTVFTNVYSGVGYIKISTFGDTTYDQFRKAVDKLKAENVEAVIFDVRNNLGGTITAVTKILDLLLPSGDIVSATYKNGETQVLATSDSKCWEIPMVVLTNQKTASAAELFAQALKDYNLAKTVGNTTYGKGSMQMLYKLQDGSALDLTIAKYNPPKSPNFDGIGVKVDYEVSLTPDQEKTFYDLNEETDPQLKKALELAVAGKNMKNSASGVSPDSSSSSSAASEESVEEESSMDEEQSSLEDEE